MKKLVVWACALACSASFLLPPAHAEEIIFMDESAYELDAPTPQPYTQGQEPTAFVTLQRGSKGEAVEQVQRRLTELGFYYGNISGSFLDGTDAAIRDFQTKNGLARNGKVTATTWNVLMSIEAIGNDGNAHLPTDPQAALEPAPTPAPPAIGAATSPNPEGVFVFERILKYQNQGEDVRALQQRLKDLGYYRLEVSGNYLGNTRDAIRAFQRNNGLKVDGVAGELTQRTLWDDALALDAASTPRPTPTPAPLRYMLKVDVTNQVTSAYELDANGEYTILARQMICSTGTKSNPTPLKTTQSKGSRARWGYFPTWGSHAQYLTRIDSSNAFHSVLYREPDPMQLVVGAYNALGSRASHGCVRLLVEDAKWIYDNCPSGTTITVYEGAPDPELRQMLMPPPLNRKTMLPQTTPEPTAPPVYDPAASPPPFRLLKKGAQGADVWWLQQRLTALGYYSGTITGGYYQGTSDAVKAFQKTAGLSADGAAGPLTQEALYAIPITVTPAPFSTLVQDTPAPQLHTPGPAPAPTPIPIHDTPVMAEPTPTPGVFG